MTRSTSDFFGSPEQQALLRRGRAMFELLRDDARFTYYGRTVGLASPEDGSPEMLEALVRLQGNSHVAIVPDADVPRWLDATRMRELAPVRYARWTGGDDAMRAAAAMRDAHRIPDDLTLARIDADAPASALASLAELSLACGVLPPAGAALRGLDRPGLALVALAPDGRAVACAAAAAYLHDDHPLGRQCWWGMLATAPERRGQRLALALGARAMLEARERLGFETVFTGVEPGNAASEAVCVRLGLAPEGRSTIGAADPALVPGGRMTR